MLVTVTDDNGRSGVIVDVAPDGLFWIRWEDFTPSGNAVTTVELVDPFVTHLNF